MKQANLTIGQNINFLGTDGEEDLVDHHQAQGAYQGAYATNITADPAGVSGSAAAAYVTEYKAAYGADALSSAGPFYGSAYEAAQTLLRRSSFAREQRQRSHVGLISPSCERYLSPRFSDR